ncbi:MAG: transporter substrate-binding domain-containing protein [Pseudomonadota bacterium]
MMRALPACLLLACCVCHAVAQSQSIPSLRIGAIDESRPNAAMSLQILAYAYAQLGISVIVENYPHQRRRQMAEQGELDGITVAVADLGSDAAGKTSNLIQLSVPIAYDEVAVYTHHQYFKVNGYESLRPYLIGYVRGIKEFEDHTQGMRTEVAPNMESLFRKLVTDRTDVVLESSSSMCMIKRLGLHDIRMLEPAVESVQMYHYLHKKNSSLVPRLEAVLLKMKQDGSMKKIQQKAMDDFLQQCR